MRVQEIAAATDGAVPDVCPAALKNKEVKAVTETTPVIEILSLVFAPATDWSSSS